MINETMGKQYEQTSKRTHSVAPAITGTGTDAEQVEAS